VGGRGAVPGAAHRRPVVARDIGGRGEELTPAHRGQ
jgi:hypothetical protein